MQGVQNEMPEVPQMMDLKEFVDDGYLQELNRTFLHPLGLALVLDRHRSDGSVTFRGIMDARDDPEGIIFTDPPMLSKAVLVLTDQAERGHARAIKFGSAVQPLLKDRPDVPGKHRVVDETGMELWHL